MPNYILKELNKELTDGKKVVFPKMQTYSLHDYETVLKHMHTYAGNFSEGTMRAVIDALVETMKSWMPMGHSMKIDGLGTFSLSLGFKDQEADDEPKTKYRHICIKGINFKPDAELLADMNRETTFDKVEADVVVPRKGMLSRDERVAKAKAVIDENGFMTLSDYVQATGLSRTGASLDLKKLVADPTSGIMSRGSHSHKVWIKRP
jgi:predicted histone-like DNA-binding protein